MSDEQPETPASAPQPGPEWIPVPQAPAPAAGADTTAPGRGVGLAAMCLGLVALLTGIVAALYLPLAGFLGAALGAAAVVLGIVALVKRQRPKGTGITGLVAGALALLLGLAVGMIGVGIAALEAIDTARAAVIDSQSAPGQDDAAEPGSLLEWPANMATAGVLFGAGLTPVASAPLTYGDVPETSEVDRENGPLDIRLYVDYRCPHCLHFEEANGEVIGELVESGAATLELVPVTFLDRVSEGGYYSSRASGALACVVDGQPEAAWDAHSTLLSAEVQPGAGTGHANAELIGFLDAGTGGLDPTVVDCIESERFVPFAQALNDWVFSTPVPHANDASLQITGTPFVLVGGEPYLGDPADPAAFAQFVAERTGA